MSSGLSSGGPPGPWSGLLLPAVTGLALGVAAGFVASLLRRRTPSARSGYVAPVAAQGPQAVPPATAARTPVIRLPDDRGTPDTGSNRAPDGRRAASQDRVLDSAHNRASDRTHDGAPDRAHDRAPDGPAEQLGGPTAAAPADGREGAVLRIELPGDSAVG